MTTIFSRVLLSLFMFGLLLSQPSLAGTALIVVDLEQMTVSPEFPAVNNWSNDTILVRIKGKDEIPQSQILSTINVPTEKYYGDSGEFPTTTGRFITITFQRCELAPDAQNCPDFRTDGTSSWNIFSPPRSFAFKIMTFDAASGELSPIMAFPIQVEQKPFGLDFSAGFAGFGGLSDKRFRLEPIADSEDANLIPVSDKDIDYQLSAFAHYMPHQFRGSNGPAVGLAIDVPVENLTIMAGWSFAARTLPVINTGYLTIGVAYAQRNRLRADFEGKSTVPASLSADTLVEKNYGFGAFVAFSFGFFGGEEEFKGVFPAGDDSGGDGN
jgi:hypothetical protein